MKTKISILVFLIIFPALAYFISSLNDKGSPAFRRGFLLNEELTKLLFSAKRMSVKKTLEEKRSPRVNGDIGLNSAIDSKNYRVNIESEGEITSLSLTDFKLLKKIEYTTDFRCIEGWSEVTQYAGVRFRDFLEQYNLGKKRDGTYYSYVALETPDGGYYVSIDMESMLHDQTVLAYEMNGNELSMANGYPIRLIIPIKYGIKSLKRIGKIYFSDDRPRDYWAERGYDWYSGL